MSTETNRSLKFILFSLGTFASHLIFGVLQELIFKSKYGRNEKDDFTFATAFVALQTILATIIAKSEFNSYSKFVILFW